MAPGDLSGRQLGNYLLGPLIGQGGMGQVYASTHRFLGTQVAIKTLRGTYAHDQTIANRFFNEARAAVEIAHPNIVRVLDFGQADDGMLYLVMERLIGRSLGAEIAHGPLDVSTAAYIARDICEGLGAAHAKGIIHRDLKPDNVFLTDTEVKILDFGIAKVLTQVTATSHGAVIGTPRYMAPEQTRGAQHAGPGSDIYALGTILFEMVTGRPPFLGDSASQLITSHLFEAPPRPSTIIAVDAELEELVLACLRKEPSERPASMSALAESLGRFVPANAMFPPMRERAVLTEMMAAQAQTADLDSAETSNRRGARVLSTLSGAASELQTGPEQVAVVGRKRAAVAGFALAAGLGLAAIAYYRAPRATLPTITSQPVRPRPTAAARVVGAPPLPEPAAAPIAAPVVAPIEAIVLRSEPPAASVSSDTGPLGTTPLVLRVPLPTVLTVSRRGYEARRELISTAGDHLFDLHKLHKGSPVPRPTATPPPGEGLD